jgi:hypothetical protein
MLAERARYRDAIFSQIIDRMVGQLGFAKAIVI